MRFWQGGGEAACETPVRSCVGTAYMRPIVGERKIRVAYMRPLQRSFPIEENSKSTPPLRVWLPEGKARRRGRALAKADSVGGHATEKTPPTGSVSGKIPLTSPTPPQGAVEKPRFEAGGMASHAAWEREPNRRVRPRGTRIRRLKAAQALHRANKRAATAAASRLRFTAVAVR